MENKMICFISHTLKVRHTLKILEKFNDKRPSFKSYIGASKWSLSQAWPKLTVPEPCHEQHWHKWPRLVHTLHLDPHRNFHRECQENYFSFKEQLSKLCFIFPPLISGFLDPHTTFWGPCFQVPPNILNSAQFLIIPHPVTKSHLKFHYPIQHFGV